jgi:hypothetical protein
VLVVQLHPEHGSGQDRDNIAFDFDVFFHSLSPTKVPPILDFNW